MPIRPIDEAEITRLAWMAKTGDRVAAADFIRATQHSVHRFLALLVGFRDAEDLTQETFLRAMRALPQFAGRSSARTWLLAIARRVAADHIRGLTRQPRATASVDTDLDLSGQAVGFDEALALAALLRDLPDERREAFVATQVLGLSYAEAAEVCGCPIGTIRSRVARARADLVAAMQAEGKGDRGQAATG